MPKIIQLDRHVADLIAAGEVVERPASAVKELVENSIDAGAKNITIELQNGGMTFLRITDDGCGMAPDDARTAFLRHATSKIRKKEDLACIGTLGFRGEALAAISAVSKIDLLTRAHGAADGVHYCILTEVGDDCCGVRCMYPVFDGRIGHGALKHGNYISESACGIKQYLSPLYRARICVEELPESCRFMKSLRVKLRSDSDFGKAISQVGSYLNFRQS